MFVSGGGCVSMDGWMDSVTSKFGVEGSFVGKGGDG